MWDVKIRSIHGERWNMRDGNYRNWILGSIKGIILEKIRVKFNEEHIILNDWSKVYCC